MLSYFFLPSQKATLLLIPYHFTIPPTSKNSIFIKILLFNLSLLFLSIRYCLGVIPFSWAFQPFFFSQAPSTSSTNHKQKHKQTQTHADKKKSSSEPIWNPNTTGTNHDHNPTTIWNLADLKPTGANPFKKNHHRSHLSHNPTTTQPRPWPTTHFSRQSTTNIPFILARRSTTNDPLHPSSPIHDHDLTTSIHNPQPTTTTDPRRHPRPKHRTHNPTTNHDQRPKHRTQQRRKREKRWCLVWIEKREERREQRMKREKWNGEIKYIYIFFF